MASTGLTSRITTATTLTTTVTTTISATTGLVINSSSPIPALSSVALTTSAIYTGTRTISSTTTCLTNVTTVSSPETNFLRFSNLMFKRAPKAVRAFFDSKHPPSCLASNLIADKVNLTRLKGSVIKQYQWDLLFPTSGKKVNSTDFDVTLLICLLRNITPKVTPPSTGFDALPAATDTSVGADLARIKHYRNLVAHTTDGKISDKDLNDYWNVLEQTLFRLGGSNIQSEVQSLRVAALDDSDKEVLIELRTLRQQLEDTIPWNVRNLINDKVAMWLNADQIFVETRASTNVYNAISNQTSVTVIGNPGSGKSATIHHVALKLKQEGYTIVIARSPSDIIAYHNREIPQVFVIDDPCGGQCADQSLLNEWMCRQDDVDLCINAKDKQSNLSCKVLVSSRIGITRNATFQKIRFLFANILNLHDSNNSLSLEERKCILKTHARIALDVPESLLSKHDCFPLLCQIFSQNENFKINPTKYFEYPFLEYCKELDLLQENAQFDGHVQYCALVLCILFGDCFTIDLLSGKMCTKTFDIVRDVYEACALDCGTSGKKIEQALGVLTGVYVREVGKTFCLVHSTLRDIIAWHFSQLGDNVHLIVKYACSSLFNERVRPEGKLKCDREEDCYFIELSDTLRPVFIERVVNDFNIGKFAESFENPSFPNQNLEQDILQSMNGNLSTYFKLLPECSESVKKLDISNIGSKRTILSLYRLPLFYWCLCYGWFTSVQLAFAEQDLVKTLVEYRESIMFLSFFSDNIELINLIFKFYSLHRSNEYLCLFCGTRCQTHKIRCPLRELFPILIPCVTGNVEVLNEMLKLKLCKTEDAGYNVVLGQEMTTPLHIAYIYGHSNIILKLDEIYNSLSILDSAGNCSLHLVCENGHLDILEDLFKKGIALNVFNKRKETPLWKACSRGHCKIVKFLCQNGASVDSSDIDHCTPLGIASVMGYIDIVSLLISHQAQVNACDNDKWSPLMRAVFGGHKKIVNYLLNHGADVNAINEDRESSLMIALSCCTEDIINLLLQYGSTGNYMKKDCGLLHIACQADREEDIFQLLNQNVGVDARGSNGITPLMVSAKNSSRRAAVVLLKNGADLTAVDTNNNTSLHIACEANSLVITKLLLSHKIDINAKNAFGKTAVYITCEKGHHEVLSLLLRKGAIVDIVNNYGLHPIHTACHNGHLEIVLRLVECGVSVTRCSSTGALPLHYASIGGHVDIVSFLLSKNVDVNTKDSRGHTALYEACGSGNVDVVEKLVSHGANVNCRTEKGCTPLINTSDKGHLEVVACLLRNGANADIKSNHGFTALHKACIKDRAKIVEMLLDAGADMYLLDAKNQDCLDLAMQSYSKILIILLGRYASSKIGNERKSQLLDIAVKNGDERLVAKLMSCADFSAEELSQSFISAATNGCENVLTVFIEHGVGIDFEHALKIKAFHAACIQGHCNIVSLLIENGLDVNERDFENFSGLDRACLKGHEDIVVKLIDCGADIHARDIHGNTCFYYANLGCHDTIMSKLIKSGVDINEINRGGLTYLHLATSEGLFHRVQILLKLGADPNILNSEGCPPLCTAVCEEFCSIVSELLRYGADVNHFCSGGSTKNVINIGLKDSLFHKACKTEDDKIMKLLFANGIDANICDEDGRTTLDIACLQENDKMFSVLLDLGIDVNYRNTDGDTPLHKYCADNKVSAVLYLLKRNASVNICNKEGFSPLDLAYNNSHYKIVSILIHHGSELIQPNKPEYTKLHIAACCKHEEHLDRSDCEYSVIECRELPRVSELINLGADVNATDRNGCTPLHVAITAGMPCNVNKLIKCGGNVNIVDKDRCSPLHKACIASNLTIAQILLNAGASINITDKEGRTPLKTACASGNGYIVSELIMAGGNINTSENRGCTPLNIAFSSDHNDNVSTSNEHMKHRSLQCLYINVFVCLFVCLLFNVSSRIFHLY